jgi:hypothetical protein
MYDNYRLCDELTPSEICFVVQQYEHEHSFIRRFHRHVPRSRLSETTRHDLLRALVIHFSKMDAETIVCCHLNNTGRKPAADTSSLRFVVSNPEPGVWRTYCGIDTQAWSDQVVRPSGFRTGSPP